MAGPVRGQGAERRDRPQTPKSCGRASHCQIGKASSREAPKAVSSNPCSRPPPSLTTHASTNIVQEFRKYAIIMRNVHTNMVAPVSLNYRKRAGYTGPNTAAEITLIPPGSQGGMVPLWRSWEVQFDEANKISAFRRVAGRHFYIFPSAPRFAVARRESQPSCSVHAHACANRDGWALEAMYVSYMCVSRSLLRK